MSHANRTADQRRADADLWIITIVSVLFLGFYMAVQSWFVKYSRDFNIPVLYRVLAGAVFQFGLAGLGITIVMAKNRESFAEHGLVRARTGQSLLLSSLCFIPTFLFLHFAHRIDGWLPFQSVWVTKEVICKGFPVNAVGMLIIWTAWGFFEGFNYVVISDIINRRYPTKCRWLNWGAIICAILCILIHGLVGVTPEDIIEMLATMALIYGMLIIREQTQNAWGVIFVFTFLWNAM
mgnify:CR=1 FL=1